MYPTMTPTPGLGQSYCPEQGLRLICSQPGPLLLLLVPLGLAPLPPPQHLQKPDFPPKPAQGAWRTHLIIQRKTQGPSPSTPPSHCPEGFENPWSVHEPPGPLWVAIGGQSMGRFSGGQLGYPEASRPGTLGCR
ncbi:hypothetical protein HJG60_012068 [Phyllostomus discolor]|uniref:Uncharacterized protein n=1 Tax=Phyllostomus discolor TaxID=89673 RepID=A0A834DWC8_9CHIR|nr:hypothetical protein HJG60_012068 [Phyllostomus discolor]